MRRTLVALTALGALLAPSSAVAVEAAGAPVTRQQLLTLADYQSVHPDLRDPSRSVFGSTTVFAPRGCQDQAQAVRGTSSIAAGLSTTSRRRSVSLIDQELVRFGSVAAARDLVRRYRLFSKRCVGDVRTDDGEGAAVLLKNRAWFPPRVGHEAAGMLIGWFSRGGVDWRRVLVVRVGRTVSVLDVDYLDVRPPQAKVVALGELAVERIG
jgi:hypothetical protein